MKNANMGKIIFSAVAIAAAFMLMSNSSCKKKKEEKVQQNDTDSAAIYPGMQAKMDTIYNAEYEAKGFIPATITDNTGLDGCSFMLLLGSGQKLIPLNLSKEYMKDKLAVWVKYKKEDAMTVCMAGETVRITEIAERK